MINPDLKKGDRVVVLYMEDEFAPIPMGTAGTVVSHANVMGDDLYHVKWDNGSQLSLISGVDMWDFEDNINNRKKSNIKEDEVKRFKELIKNPEVFNFFNIKFLRKYLLLVRDSGIVNMYQSSPYLYLGRERIEHEFKYQRVPDEEKFEEVLDMANQSQAEMINGVIKYLESIGKEPDLNNINLYLRRLSQSIVQKYMLLF